MELPLLQEKTKKYPEFENTKNDKLHSNNLLDSITVLGQVGQLTELQLINPNSTKDDNING